MSQQDTEPTLEAAAEVVQNAITQLDEYETFLSVKTEVDADPTVQEHRTRVERLQRECVRAREEGTLTDEQVAELETARDELHNLELVQEYQQAHAALTARLDELNTRISSDLAVDFGESVGSCCQER